MIMDVIAAGPVNKGVPIITAIPFADLFSSSVESFIGIPRTIFTPKIPRMIPPATLKSFRFLLKNFNNYNPINKTVNDRTAATVIARDAILYRSFSFIFFVIPKKIGTLIRGS